MEDADRKRITKDWKTDTRPAKSGWLPGSYCGICKVCGEPYIGDRRSWCCGDCAYSDDAPKLPTR